MGDRSVESAQELLAHVVAIESHTFEGQDRLSDFIVDYARGESLGDVRKVLYPAGCAYADETPCPSNVVIYMGDEAPDMVKRNTLVTVHYDTVPPHEAYEKKGIDPLRLRQEDATRPYLVSGLGVGDMKGPLVSMLLAAKALKGRLPPGQGLTLAAVGHEEQHSQGFHALQHGDLLKHVSEAICLEIQVGSKLGQHPVLLAGRPGRVELQVDIQGKSSHTGAVSTAQESQYVFSAYADALKAIRKIRLPEHPLDFPNDPIGNTKRWLTRQCQRLLLSTERQQLLMPRAKIVPTFGRMDAPLGMSIANHGWFHADALYSNPALNAEAIRAYVQQELRRLLPDVQLSVMLDPKRKTPSTGPWREDVPREPFVQEAFGIGKGILPDGKNLYITYGEPTADEALISLYRHVPTVCLPPDMEGEHTERETLDVRSLVDSQMPFIQGVVLRPRRAA
jgi:acetylornithine deacetylase/succinyl-diaminopimelate desuccinylase-like protein